MAIEKNSIRALDRAFDIIESFSFKEPLLTLVEIAEKTGLANATVHRSLKTMIDRGYIEKDSKTGKFKLGMEFVRVGGVVVQSTDVVSIATPFLEKLAKTTELNTNLSVYDRGKALCLINIESFHRFGHEIKVGQRLPIYAGALSKAIFAALPEQEIEKIISQDLELFTPNTIAEKEVLLNELNIIKERGYSVSKGELSLGVKAFAKPLFNYEHKMVGGIAISGPDYFIKEEMEENLLNELNNTADEISKELGFKKMI
ncbi:IclR family transcriptional regulator [Bacillus marinisedimentorum]|uniref:IclR family transcriptional regulator n=1 Tax=Bacillus marinisedimentorum TaxID=1821260 RepID=UPI0007DEF780|nr:IclR family transcriptional regulator [Bacillus marinisedimentorum]